MSSFETAFLYPLDKYLVVQFLGGREVPFLIFWVMSRVAAPLAFPPAIRRDPVSPQPRQPQLLPPLSMLAFLAGIRWCPIVVLICNSLMSDEHFFTCLVAIWKSSLEQCLFMSLAHFFTGFFVLWVSSLSSLQILDTNPLSDKSLAHIFSHSIGCLLVLLFPSLCRSFFILMRPQ